jgi:hypothetical protein
MKPEPILSGLRAAGAGGQGPQWAVEPVEEEEEEEEGSHTYARFEAVCKSRSDVRLGKFPVVRRTLFCMRCKCKRYVFAANSQV